MLFKNLFEAKSPVTKAIKAEIAQIESDHEIAPQKIAELTEQLDKWRVLQDAPFSLLKNQMNDLIHGIESLLINPNNYKPKNALFFASAVVMLKEKMSVDEVCENLGSDSRYDVILASAKNHKDLSVNRVSGEVMRMHLYEPLYIELGLDDDLAQIKDMSEAYEALNKKVAEHDRKLKSIGLNTTNAGTPLNISNGIAGELVNL